MSRPSGFQKVSLVAKHMVKHKQILMYEDIEATEMDQNYIEASELFLAFSAQTMAVITQTEIFQKRISEALSASTEQADAFVRMSQGGRRTDGGQDGDWLLAARARTSLLYSVVKEGTGVVNQIMDEDLNDRLIVALRRELDSYSKTPRLMRERLKTRMEVQHYSRKIEELNKNPKALLEKIERNKEKYAQTVQSLHDQTKNLMNIFSKAERLRQQLLCDDLNTIIALQQHVFDSISNTIRLTSGKIGPSHNPSSRTDTPGRTAPSICTQSIGSPLSLRSLSPSMAKEGNFHSSRPPSHSQCNFSDVPLDDTLTIEGAAAHMKNGGGAVRSPQQMPLDGKEQAILSSHGSTCRRCGEDGPKGSQSTTSSNNTCTPIGTICTPNAKRMDRKQVVETQVLSSSSAVNAAVSRGSPSTDHCSSEKLLNDDSSEKRVPDDKKSQQHALQTQGSPYSSVATDTVSMDSSGIDSLERSASGDRKSPHAAAPNDDGPQNASREEEETPPGMVKVRALFDYEGAEEGDLSFMAEDIILTYSVDWANGGWVEGTNGSRKGMFPSNYCILMK